MTEKIMSNNICQGNLNPGGILKKQTRELLSKNKFCTKISPVSEVETSTVAV